MNAKKTNLKDLTDKTKEVIATARLTMQEIDKPKSEAEVVVDLARKQNREEVKLAQIEKAKLGINV